MAKGSGRPPSVPTIVKAANNVLTGDRPYRPLFCNSGEGGDRPQRPSTAAMVVIVRVVLASIVAKVAVIVITMLAAIVRDLTMHRSQGAIVASGRTSDYDPEC